MSARMKPTFVEKLTEENRFPSKWTSGNEAAFPEEKLDAALKYILEVVDERCARGGWTQDVAGVPFRNKRSWKKAKQNGAADV